MNAFRSRLVLALLAAAPALPCFAGSSAASSASDSISQTMGSISDSFGDSSHASSPDNRQAMGDYKVIDVAEVDGRPGMVALRLQRVAAAPDARDALTLTVPRAAAQQGGVVADAVVTAVPRPYGVEFEAGARHAAFFLALADDWERDLKAAPVTL